MSNPYLAEIRLTSFAFAPKGWALCNGQLLPINQNQALFALLGTTYGGDGRTNFALPDLQGRAAMHFSGTHALGEAGGEEAHTLTIGEMPAHGHALRASGKVAASSSPNGGVLAAVPRGGTPAYTAPTAMVPLNPAAIGASGGGQPHENRPPFLTVNFIIALQGIFPSRN
ncbi:MAG TPA: tail fiber protein [Burkholderiaceae bacterium]